MNKECQCTECLDVKRACNQVFDTLPRELVWLINRFARANPFKEDIPSEFISYPFVRTNLFHALPRNPEFISEQVLKFLYPAINPTFSSVYYELWSINNNITFSVAYDIDNFEWMGTIKTSDMTLTLETLCNFNVSAKPDFVLGGKNLEFIYPFFGVSLGANCYHVMKHTLKKYEHEIRQFLLTGQRA
jgi:hypothetical protein